ncbi:MAG: hypothetical protein BIP78_0002 [Candidatus Bipolaricaulis sibiricus]|uniref:Uncharacterized protein n=1 Tax=Bipolaricaulis sibiricus TaxID=2501609 RepID=A0A410FS73_BIPS1|nr:MAG: hypothetical protein BIP78_0002 [Candidatus Bipolaricaulis sibiricus]
MSSALKWAAVGLALLWGAGAAAASLSLEWEGKLVWTLPSPTPALSATLALTWTVLGWEWISTAVHEDTVWKALTFTGTGGIGDLDLSSALAFDPQEPAFRSLTVRLKAESLGVTLDGVARLESRGLGWGLTLVGPRDGLVERVRLRFNLKRFLDEALEDTFASSFSSGEVLFRIALPCCVERLRGWLSFTKVGFSEFGLSLPLPLPRETGLAFSTVVRFRVDEKTTFVAPAMIYEPPACVEVYLGLDWDRTTWAIRGIQTYAVGFRCQLGAVRVRGITELRPIGLVKRPYWEAIWVSWEGEGCCGPTKFQVAAYFGDANLLFGLGEVDVGVEVPVAPGVVIGLGAEMLVPGDARLSLSWRAEL